jgi:hypothetical protein
LEEVKFLVVKPLDEEAESSLGGIFDSTNLSTAVTPNEARIKGCVKGFDMTAGISFTNSEFLGLVSFTDNEGDVSGWITERKTYISKL